jgi:hypothetical protein
MKRITVQCGIGEDKAGHAIESQRVRDCLQAVHRHASDEYGGVTVYRHVGSWVDGHGSLVTEHGITIQVLTGKDDDGGQFAIYVRNLFNQNTVVLTVEDVNCQFI